MKTIKIKVGSECGYVGCNGEEIIEVEVEDDISPSELDQLCEEEARDWFFNFNSYWYDIIE